MHKVRILKAAGILLLLYLVRGPDRCRDGENCPLLWLCGYGDRACLHHRAAPDGRYGGCGVMA